MVLLVTLVVAPDVDVALVVTLGVAVGLGVVLGVVVGLGVGLGVAVGLDVAVVLGVVLGVGVGAAPGSARTPEPIMSAAATPISVTERMCSSCRTPRWRCARRAV
ncbi:hypothetical protein [Streptosporangium sp. NPDC002607]